MKIPILRNDSRIVGLFHETNRLSIDVYLIAIASPGGRFEGGAASPMDVS